MASSTGYHEPAELLSAELRDRHRALVSLQEELEAIDWYDQRVEAATDPELGALLAHNRDEEKEHATMLLEWLRRRDGRLAEMAGRYLDNPDPPLVVEARAKEVDGPAPATCSPGDVGLGVGSLRGRPGL